MPEASRASVTRPESQLQTNLHFLSRLETSIYALPEGTITCPLLRTYAKTYFFGQSKNVSGVIHSSQNCGPQRWKVVRVLTNVRQTAYKGPNETASAFVSL